MCPLYVSGLIGPGDRKSIQPMAERLALGEYDQLHHFIAVALGFKETVATGRSLTMPLVVMLALLIAASQTGGASPLAMTNSPGTSLPPRPSSGHSTGSSCESRP